MIYAGFTVIGLAFGFLFGHMACEIAHARREAERARASPNTPPK